VGIERKKIHDLIDSMTTGRLSGHQLIGMLKTYNVIYLVVEGLWQSSPKDGTLQVYKKKGWQTVRHGKRRYMGREISNFLNTLSIITNVKVVRTSNAKQTGLWLSDTYSWWAKPWNKHTSYKELYSEPIPVAQWKRPNLITRIWKEFESVKWVRAKALAINFPTLMSMACADEKDLTKVEGIGKGTAQSILREIQEMEDE
jgi:ERCC4-type nuclease